MKRAYVKVEAEYAQGRHGETWVELEGSEHFMHRLSEDDFAAHVLAGFPSQLYMASADGELIAKPFEALNLFGENNEPEVMRFTKARVDLVAA
jgi:hypothetical protein